MILEHLTTTTSSILKQSSEFEKYNSYYASRELGHRKNKKKPKCLEGIQ